jgi:hypothetical protein
MMTTNGPARIGQPAAVCCPESSLMTKDKCPPTPIRGVVVGIDAGGTRALERAES